MIRISPRSPSGTSAPSSSTTLISHRPLPAQHPAFPIAYLAAQKLGAVVVSVNIMLTTGELDYVLTDSGAKVIFTTEALWPTLEPLPGHRLSHDRVVICEGDVPGLPTLPALGGNHPPGFKAREMDQDAPV